MPHTKNNIVAENNVVTKLSQPRASRGGAVRADPAMPVLGFILTVMN
jgi:hypothetical protein